MYYRISKNEKNLFFGKKIAQVWAVTLKEMSQRDISFKHPEHVWIGDTESNPF